MIQKTEKRILYLTDTASDAKSGAGSNCRMHRLALNDIASNLYYIYLQEIRKKSTESNEDIYYDQQNTLQKCFSIFSGYPSYLTKEKREGILRRIEEYQPDTIYFDMSICGRLSKIIKKRFPKCRIVTFFHDIEYDLLHEQIKGVEYWNLLRKLALMVQIKNEKYAAKYSDAYIVLNERDRNRFREVYNEEATIVLPALNLCRELPEEQSDRITKKDEIFRILFVGGYYGPNNEGILWFCENVAKYLRSECRIEIVGKGMEKLRETIGNLKLRNVDVIGTVDSLDDYYLKADVVIGPIFSGGGMKTKTGEAFSYGKRFVGTTESLLGYVDNAPSNFLNKYIYVCETKEDFINTINNLSGADNKKATYIEILGWFREHYSIEAARDIYLKVL